MRWYRDLENILKVQSELWLAYLYGHSQARARGSVGSSPAIAVARILLGAGVFLTHMLLNAGFSLDRETTKKSKRFLAFFGTLNQESSLSPTIRQLVARNEDVLVYSSRKFLRKYKAVLDCHPIVFSPLDVSRAMFLLALRGCSLYQKLRIKEADATRLDYAQFFATYAYLVHFYRILKEVRPEYVIVANDHNVPNRCLLAVSHFIGVKTVYLQHASVSDRFPALRVNYAFLDGRCALDTYRQCEGNRPLHHDVGPEPIVILSGQKKEIRCEHRTIVNRRVVGLALNSLDKFGDVKDLVEKLARAKFEVVVRWHPRSSARELLRYREVIKGFSSVSFSDPLLESVSDFFHRIGWLVAANSSIHLEAALAGIPTIYYEMSKSDIPDYYGFVKNGLSVCVNGADEVVALLAGEKKPFEINVEAVRYYSATYRTEWDGREGELVASCLLGEIPKMFGPESIKF